MERNKDLPPSSVEHPLECAFLELVQLTGQCRLTASSRHSSASAASSARARFSLSDGQLEVWLERDGEAFAAIPLHHGGDDGEDGTSWSDDIAGELTQSASLCVTESSCGEDGGQVCLWRLRFRIGDSAAVRAMLMRRQGSGEVDRLQALESFAPACRCCGAELLKLPKCRFAALPSTLYTGFADSLACEECPPLPSFDPSELSFPAESATNDQPRSRGAQRLLSLSSRLSQRASPSAAARQPRTIGVDRHHLVVPLCVPSTRTKAFVAHKCYEGRLAVGGLDNGQIGGHSLSCGECKSAVGMAAAGEGGRGMVGRLWKQAISVGDVMDAYTEETAIAALIETAASESGLHRLTAHSSESESDDSIELIIALRDVATRRWRPQGSDGPTADPTNIQWRRAMKVMYRAVVSGGAVTARASAQWDLPPRLYKRLSVALAEGVDGDCGGSNGSGDERVSATEWKVAYLNLPPLL
ncbi:unnamed protein product [Vitrella brassicaformis CCMP3155]|uniref:Uncharacterized protein n=1 Tax=Vitrella brassicaformis (strain CCMP3155) TaxID=1169540 RepID=A0A0G4G1N2_VITBC|nr:unnamed protein product [Vitrella brassicaformis CCMP3155]|eukprot:CEM21633.1 unnamed protein product [Vitrella brassicaformis CCMP3155]